jgi:hypothetical protein
MSEQDIKGSANIKWLMEVAKERGWPIEKLDDSGNKVKINGKIYNLLPDGAEGTKWKKQITSMKILGPDKFSKEDIDAMRETLAEAEWEGSKDAYLKEILREGCLGWENTPDEEVVEQYQNIYGETDNVEIVQGEVTAKFNDIK